MRIFFALKVFFQILFSAQTSRKIVLALNPPVNPMENKPSDNNLAENKPSEDKQPEKIVEKIVEKVVVEKPVRSDALTLLAALQREARLIDFLQENIQPFDDAQIGAIVRDIHRDCGTVINRMFDIAPLSEIEEGHTITLDAPFDPLKFQIIGANSEARQITGTVVHPGWKANKCEVPVWKGTPETAAIIAPTEIEK